MPLRELLHTDAEVVGEGDSATDFGNIYPALVQCFGTIFLGYLAAKFLLISEVEAKGINAFVGLFALPALIFVSLCKLNFGSMDWIFLTSILLSKAIVFFVVLLVTLVIDRDPSLAGLFAIFSTQSNDFALGFPILQALYSKTHPEYPNYVYLIAPINLVILNPVGFVLLEVGKARSDDSNTVRKILKLVKSIISNPIIFMTVLGILANYVFNSEVPFIADSLLSSLGNAFSSAALFLLGTRMALGVKNQNDVILPGLLIAMKLVALPLVAREVTSLLITASSGGENSTTADHFSNLAFLYGTFPTAPSVYVYAAKYGIAQDLIATSMVVGTFIAGPIMFISARLISLKVEDPSDYIPELNTYLLNVSVMGFFTCLWTLFVFTIRRQWKLIPHYLTVFLAAVQMMACIGAILWATVDCSGSWLLYLQFGIYTFGVYASRITTALLAVKLLLTRIYGRCILVKLQPVFLSVGVFAPSAIVTIMSLVVREKDSGKVDPNFQYGIAQAYVGLIVLVLSFLVTVFSLIAGQRIQKAKESVRPTETKSIEREEPSVDEEDDQPLIDTDPRHREDEETPMEIEDLMLEGGRQNSCDGSRRSCTTEGRKRYRCDSEHRRYCSSLLERYSVPPALDAVEHLAEEAEFTFSQNDEFQIFRHTVLLLLLTASMFIGIALCIWTIVLGEISGIYLELVFLDGFFNLGQGLFTFAVFGIDTKYLLEPLKSWYRTLAYGADSLHIPNWEDLELETKHHCQQFLKHHIDKCMESIVTDVRSRLTTHRAVFRGKALVDWLMDVGLAYDRPSAELYGKHLIKGRVIRHIENHIDFYDDDFIYTFETSHHLP